MSNSDDLDLPPVGLRDHELESWFERRHGRRPTSAELRALHLRISRRFRRRLVEFREAGLTEAQTAAAIAKDFMTSFEFQAALATGFALVRAGMEISDLAAPMLARIAADRARVAGYARPSQRVRPLASPPAADEPPFSASPSPPSWAP